MNWKSTLVVCLLALLVAGGAWGQSGNGSVRGTVKDQTGAVIPASDVTVTNTATNTALKSKTNEAGLYVFPAVAPGPYSVTVEFTGMAKFEATFTVRVGESTTVDVTMQPASTTTVVKVEDVTPMVITDSPTLGHVLEQRRIEQLPINGRDVMNLLWTVPGITYDNDGILRTFGTRQGTHDVVLDGAALTDSVYGEKSVARPPSLDSIQEFRVENNSSSAKYTRQTSIIMVTKGGTNDVHGSLFETNRDYGYGVARARDNMSNTAAKYIRNEYGGSVGGPVYIPKVYNGKNKTFWFFSYEGMKSRQGGIQGYRVPTQAMRDGDFSGLKDAAGTQFKLYDPFATDPNTYARPQFNYGGTLNRIDPALESPLYKTLVNGLPLPNKPDVNPLVANNYFGPASVNDNEWTWSARFDQHISDNDQVWGRITNAVQDIRRAASGGVPTIGNSRRDNWPNKSLAATWTHTFSSTLFNEFMFSASRSAGGSSTGDANELYATELGLPNPNNQVGYPVINNLGVGTGKSNYIQPVSARQQWFNYFILEDNATKIKGKHELQFGAHLRYDQLTYLPQQQRSAGSVTFTALGTALYDPTVPNRTRGVLNTGHVAASAYLGLATYQYRMVKQKYYMRQNEDALYFQDNWRATSRLTVNLGLRWQFSPYPKDKYDIFSAFDTNNMAIVLANSLDNLYAVGATHPGLINGLQSMGAKFESAQQAGFPSRLVNNNWFDIGPHLGFAYRALEGRKSFVVRGGFSSSYFPVPIYGWNDNFRLNAPFTGFYDNSVLTSAAQSPDGKRNYALVGAPPVVAGVNSANAVSVAGTGSMSIGSDSFTANFFDPNQPSSRIYDWNLTVEKPLWGDTVLRMAYIGNHAAHQDSYQMLNEQTPFYVWYKTTGLQWPDNDYADALTRPLDNPNGATDVSRYPYGDINMYGRDGWGNSNGAQIEIERRMSHGYGFQAFYTLVNSARAAGHGWYDGTEAVSAFMPGAVPTDLHDRMKLLMYSRDTTVPQHEIRWNWVVDLPFGKGKPVLGNAGKFLNQVIGGWQVSGMGRIRSNFFALPTELWPTGSKVEYYGHKYEIQDCRSGECQAGWLAWNGYIPANLINKPNGIMGVPADYKPAGQPVNAYPANYDSLQGDDPNAPGYDPNYGYYGGNNVKVPLKDGSLQDVDKGDLNPWRNQPILSTFTWNMDASLGKAFSIKERAKLRFQCDFFNVFNNPGNDPTPIDSTGIVSKSYGINEPRVLQLSLRLNW